MTDIDFLTAKIALGFDRLDVDGDGFLSPEEFVTAIIEFWSSPDPDTPGNWWMGALATTNGTGDS